MSMASAGDGSDGSFNRTFMELKCRWRALAMVRTGGFNRTFMELK